MSLTCSNNVVDFLDDHDQSKRQGDEYIADCIISIPFTMKVNPCSRVHYLNTASTFCVNEPSPESSSRRLRDCNPLIVSIESSIPQNQ